MKKLIYILLGAGLCTSCNFLDTEIYDNPDAETIYQDATSCMSGLAGVYDILGYAGTYGQYLWGDLDAGTISLSITAVMVKTTSNPTYIHTTTQMVISRIAGLHSTTASTAPTILSTSSISAQTNNAEAQKTRKCILPKLVHCVHSII